MSTEQPQRERPIDIIRRHSRTDRRRITIPEWGNLELYFGKVTQADLDVVEGQIRTRPAPVPRSGEPAPEMEVSAADVRTTSLELLRLKAELEDGTPAFESGDIYYLRHEADATVVQRLLAFMYKSAHASVRDAEEAINQDPFSDSGSSLPPS